MKKMNDLKEKKKTGTRYKSPFQGNNTDDQ